MAVAAVTLTRTGAQRLGQGGVLQEFNMAIAPAADTYATGGLSMPWRSAAVGTTKPPLPGTVVAKGLAGYHFEYDDTNQKMKVRQSAAAANPEGELPAAAIPAGLSGDTIKVSAVFPFGG